MKKLISKFILYNQKRRKVTKFTVKRPLEYEYTISIAGAFIPKAQNRD
jgi:hypothetical protein